MRGSRKTAVLITVVVAILATLFGVNRSLRAEAAKVERMFYEGVYLTDEKYTQPSIDSQLTKRAQSAYMLTTLAEYYDGLGDKVNDVLAWRDQLMHTDRISEKGLANFALQEAFDSLYSAFLAASPDERDRALAEQYAATFYGAQTAIDESQYNYEVYQYTEKIGFPTVVLRPLVLVREPEFF